MCAPAGPTQTPHPKDAALSTENVGADPTNAAPDSVVQFRYGIVFLLTLALVLFVIAAPNADWSRAVTLAIEGVALIVALATGRERAEVRERKAVVVSVALIVLIILVATGLASRELTAAANAVLTAAIPVVIFGGVVRLLRTRGVTVQAVAGALSIYLSVGLVFAFIIGFITRLDSTLYFAQNTNGTEGERVYFSFTVLTTTGFGDFTPATPVGHALAVIEMLTGQLYLVTVIGLLIGNIVSRQKQDEPQS